MQPTDKQIDEQIKSLDIPYPQKFLFKRELSYDLEHISLDDKPLFSEDDLQRLRDVHSTKAHLFLSNLKSRERKIIESLTAFLPLICVFTLTLKEEIVINFIREGGIPSMYAILIVGGFLLGREILNIFRLVIIKNHSPENLQIDTPSVLLGSLALVFLGIGGTFLGFYVSADAVIQSKASYEILLVGAKESLTPTILSAFFAVLVILAHFGTRRILHIWRAPVGN